MSRVLRTVILAEPYGLKSPEASQAPKDDGVSDPADRPLKKPKAVGIKPDRMSPVLQSCVRTWTALLGPHEVQRRVGQILRMRVSERCQNQELYKSPTDVHLYFPIEKHKPILGPS
jgi:hypothetical protein